MRRRAAPTLVALALVVGLIVVLRMLGSDPADAGNTVADADGRDERTLEAAEIGDSVLPVLPAEPVALTLLTGTVRIAGEGGPVPDVRVDLGGRDATATDDDGAFVFVGLEPGAVELSVDPGYPFAASTRSVQLSAGENVLDLELEPRFALTVTVLEATPGSDRRGEALEGASVHLEPAWLSGAADGDGAAPSGLTDAEGRCHLVGIPTGLHVLAIEADGHVPTELTLGFRYADLTKLGHLARREITVGIGALGGTLNGRVFGPDGEGLSGVLVCLDARRAAATRFGREREVLEAPPYTLTDASGAFTLPVPTGHAEFALLACANRPGLVPIVLRTVDVRNVGKEQLLRILPADRVELRVVHPDGSSASGRMKVSDGKLAYDLVSDPVLARIPGFAAAFLPAASAEPGHLSLFLRDGGYTVLFEPDAEGAAAKAFFISVLADGPRVFQLVLDG